jgi:Leucine-rich repeat (LRR) protein
MLDKLRTKTGYVNHYCPFCFDRNCGDTWDGVSSCGYKFPLSFMVGYDDTWSYNEALIEKMLGYEGLRLAGKFTGKNTSLITDFMNLRQLYISRYNPFEFSFLSSLGKLEILELDFCNLENCNDLEINTSLKSLMFTECKKLVDISSLNKLKNLRFLEITLCNRIENLANVLSTLTNLRFFSVENKQIESVKFVGSLKNLEVLNLNTKVLSQDITPLLLPSKLKDLSMKKNTFPKNSMEQLKIHFGDTLSLY